MIKKNVFKVEINDNNNNDLKKNNINENDSINKFFKI